MKTFNRISIVLLFLIAGWSGLHAQEFITPLFGNPVARSFHETSGPVKKSTGDVLLELPFFDDFSTSRVVPDPTLWSDRSAYINNQYGVDPRTNGVATLDVLDFDGSIYPHAVKKPATFVADHLTSFPINLEYQASDSIYLSFLYQPQGIGDMPDPKDSLLVDFYSPVDSMWTRVWGIPGDTLHEFTTTMIPIKEDRYLKSGFRFRFRNRASLQPNKDFPDKTGNVDHWNLDYIRLDRFRFAGDTILRDVAFSQPLGSILKDLSSLPWSQFETAYAKVLDPNLPAVYKNLDTIARNVTRSLSIEELLFQETYSPGTPTAQDIPAGGESTVEFGFIYPIDFDRGDSAVIRYTAALRTDEFDPKENDTVYYDQVYSDYWSYDDGTAEAGYGLRGQGTANGNVAMKYHSFEPGRLGGVDISFNHLYDSLNLGYYFKLMVWGDAEGLPGANIHEDENDVIPVYATEYPGFIRYYFSSPVPVDGTFYVGWRQYQTYLLNVGLDMNTRLSPPGHVLQLPGILAGIACSRGDAIPSVPV